MSRKRRILRHIIDIVLMSLISAILAGLYIYLTNDYIRICRGTKCTEIKVPADNAEFPSGQATVHFENQDPYYVFRNNDYDLKQFSPWIELTLSDSTNPDICVIFTDRIDDYCPDAAGCAFKQVSHIATRQGCNAPHMVYVDNGYDPISSSHIVVHELLHTVGLAKHSNDQTDILYPSFSTDYPSDTITPESASRLDAIYGSH